jgi:20S proteasome alpha/beta subunit
VTVLVGIRSRDGVVVGADSSATFGDGSRPTIEQSAKKIEIVHGRIIVAGTGQVGLGQRFCNVVDHAYGGQALKNKNGVEAATEICRLALNDFGQTGAPRGQFGALVAFPAKHELHLCEFALADFQPELKTSVWYASMGSGQPIADPFLGFMRRVFWSDGALPSLQDSIFAVTWALFHAIDVNPGGINEPMQMAVLTLKEGVPTARFLTDDELSEHRQNAIGAEEHLRQYRDILLGKAAQQAPDIPKAPGQA